MMIGSITGTLFLFVQLLQVASRCNNTGDFLKNGWKEYNGALYKWFHGTGRDYYASESYCQSYGGSLTTAKTAGENNIVRSILGMGQGVLFIGLKYNGSTWMWNDGTPANYTDWITGVVFNHPNDDCVYTYYDVPWTPTSCYSTWFCICKCTIAVGCNATNPCSNSYAECVSDICQCRPGYTLRGTLCTAAVGAACDTPNGCSNPYASCTSGTCQCNTGYTTSGTLCKAVVGVPCDAINGCSSPYADCTNGSTATCQCKFGYKRNETLCKAELESYCFQPDHCADTNAECTEMKCFCRFGYYDENGDTTGGRCGKLHIFQMNVSVNLVDVPYTENLLNLTSPEYTSTSTDVLQKIKSLLSNVTWYNGSTILGFHNGSDGMKIVDIEITKWSPPTTNMDDIKSIVRKILRPPGVIDHWNLYSYQLGGAVITPSDSVFLNGTNGFLTCTCKGLSTLEWYYKGSNITSINNSRIQIEKLAISNESTTSNLAFEPVIESDIGLYECVCQTNNSEYVVGIRMTCLVQAVVYVVPVMKTVANGSNVTINCKLANNAERVSFQWYKDEKPLDNGSVSSDYTASRLIITNVTQSANYLCRGHNSAGYGNNATAIIHVLSTNGGYCNESTDDWNTTWEHTNVDVRLTKRCPSNYTGEATRFCMANREWENPDYGQCVSDKLNDLKYQIEKLENGILVTNASTVLTELQEVTKPTVTILKEAELKTVVSLLNKIIVIIELPSAPVSNDVSENFLKTASNIIDRNTTYSWQSLISKNEPAAETVLMAVESFVKGLSESAQNNVSTINGSFQTNNIDVGIGYNSLIAFPIQGNDLSSDNRINSTSLRLQTDDVHRYAAVLFRKVSGILPSRAILNGKTFDRLDVGPDVMSLQLNPWPTNETIKIRLMFQAFNTVYTNPICSYWELNATGKGDGAWSSEGCSYAPQNSSDIVCECNHLTNFAILMTTYEATDPGHNVRLSIISSVGCAVSIICLLLTILGHLQVWRYVKTRRTYIVLSICVALIFSYGIFLAGVNRTENKVVCTAVAALLHYLYLTVFFLMLVEGIEIAVSVLFVFFSKSRLKLLLPLAWLIPAGIVGASMSISQLSGYGNKQLCWLSVRDGLIWAFVGPAALVILFNAVIIFIVIKKMFSTSAFMSKTKKDKAKTSLRSLGVLLPVTGVTWILGIFSVNEDLVVFQYMFTLFNSLQGLFIFVFHCLLNNQIRDAMAARKRRKKSLETSTTNLKSAATDESKIRRAANTSQANLITTCDESEESNARMRDICMEKNNLTTRQSKWQLVLLQLQTFVKSSKDKTLNSIEQSNTEIDCGSEAQENLEN